jgi:hypothetical protein
MDMRDDCWLSAGSPPPNACCTDGRRESANEAPGPSPLMLPSAPTTDGRALARPELLWLMVVGGWGVWAGVMWVAAGKATMGSGR